MAIILSHTVRRLPARMIAHTFLVDIKEKIPIECLNGNEAGPSAVKVAQHVQFYTSVFEIMLEVESGPESEVNNATVEPVSAQTMGEWKLFGHVIRKGKWVVNQRCNSPGTWIYSDDFLLLQVSCGTLSVDSMLSLFTGRLEEIATALSSGNRIISHSENRERYRESVMSSFGSGESSFSVSPGTGFDFSQGSAIRTALPRISFVTIEEISDTSWLFE